MIFGRNQGRNHINFWLAEKIGEEPGKNIWLIKYRGAVIAVFSVSVRSPSERLSHPSFASVLQKIEDLLGVAMYSQQHEVLFSSLKRTNS